MKGSYYVLAVIVTLVLIGACNDSAIVGPVTESDQLSASKAGAQVTLCHFPPDTPNNPQVITVNAPAAEAHIRDHALDGKVGGPFRDEAHHMLYDESCQALPSANSVGMEFVFIEAGTFMMGSDQGLPREQPVHAVTLTRDFYAGKHEVTQEQWEAVMGTTIWDKVVPEGWLPVGVGPDYPMHLVSWYDAVAFANALSQAEGLAPCYDAGGNVIGASGENVYACQGYRLLTEAEWEYVARAGTTTEYTWGENLPHLAGHYAWYTANSGGETHEVGQKLPNPWGLYDVHGNTWEWVHDWYSPSYYSSSPSTDPLGPSTSNARVFRGGSWFDFVEFLRPALRFAHGPVGQQNNYGFRLARTAL